MSQRINYIKNPSFKGGSTAFWAPLGSGVSISSVTETAHLGDSSLRVQKADGVVDCGVKIDGYRIPVTEGSTYTLSAYVRMPRELEFRTYTCKIDWYSVAEGGSSISSTENSVEIFNYQVLGSGFLSVYATGVAPQTSTYAEISIYQEEAEDDTSAQPFRYFFIDSVMFEESPYIRGFFENITQEKETTTVNKSLSPVPYPEITGMELNADINLNGLVFNTIDEDGILWVCTDIEGWWGNSEPEVANITRGLGDGSYDVRGRYAARDIEFSGVFLPPSKDMVLDAREKLITAIDLVKTNGWLVVDEEPPKASLVRLVGRPNITTVSPRGKTEFSFTLRASDPIKYEWIYGNEDARDFLEIPINGSLPVLNKGTSPVSAVFQLHGPMEVGTYVRNLANQQTFSLAQRLRGENETTEIVGLSRIEDIAKVRTNTSSGIVEGDFIKVSSPEEPSFNTSSSIVLSVIDDPNTETYEVSYLNEAEDFVRLSITGKSFTDNVATLTVSPDSGFSTNTSVIVSGVGGLFNGIYNLASSTGNTITYNRVVSPTSIIKASRASNVATITTNTSLGILGGDKISISSEIGENFNTESVTALSVVDDTTTNNYQITYTSDFYDFGKYTIVNKSLTSNVAKLTTSETAPFTTNANRIVRLGSNGLVDKNFASKIGSGFNNAIATLALQSDGKIVAGGTFTTFNGTASNNISRLNSDGTLDINFALNTGTGLSRGLATNVSPEVLAIQSDGKIVVGGFFDAYNSVTSNNITRLNTDGTRDTDFTTNIGTGFGLAVFALAIQSDDKIVAGGTFTTHNGVTSNRIARLNADGTRDTDFTTAIGTGFNSTVSDTAIQSDGKIVVVGDFTTHNGVTSNRIARLNTDGTRDTDFTTAIGTGFNGEVSDTAIQSDGKIVVVGAFTTHNGVTSNRIARLNADGTRDTDFTTAIGTGFSFTPAELALQADGKIIVGVAGSTTFNEISVNGISSLNSDGTLNTEFNTNKGSGIPTGFGSGNAIAIQSDTKIILGGGFSTGKPFFTSTNVVVSGVDSTFDGVYQTLIPDGSGLDKQIRYNKVAANVASTAVTSNTAFAEYSAPTGSVVALSGVTDVDSADALVEYSPSELTKIGLAESDILEVDTFYQEAALNGNALGNRFYLDTLIDWVSLEKGNNSLELSYTDNPIIEKSITSNVATLTTLQDHNFRVGDSVKIQGVDEFFDNTFSITSINTSSSFSFVLEEEDLAETEVTSPDAIVANDSSYMIVYYRSGWLG